MKRVLLIYLLIMSSVEENEKSVLEALSSSLGHMVLKCQNELEFKNDVIQDLLDFWNKKNELRSTDLGCALVCVFGENDFLTEDFTDVQKANVEAFFKSAGADEIMAGHMVELFQLCQKSTKTIKNLCDSALEMAKCFRYGIFEMRWAPKRDYWSRTKVSNRTESEQVSSERKMFTKFFRSCRK